MIFLHPKVIVDVKNSLIRASQCKKVTEPDFLEEISFLGKSPKILSK